MHQNAYQERRKASVSPGKWSDALAALLEEKLAVTWSPEQITERFLADRLPAVSFKTIYRWIYAGRLVQGTLQVLRHKGKRQKPAETHSKFAIGRTISDRPKEVRSRETFGHWELDTVVLSGRGKSKGCVATLIERKTRLYTAVLNQL
ncbi:IS30 family transposase [Paenibacillus sp. RU5M]|uniref:IS30 family transposase n=1 Tax=Paenibacillus sp. RU5M TaxID=1907396 RepID=UPI00359C115F